MSITIVIPVLNREKTLPATLQSIAGQTMQPDEIILVDNGSTDRSREIMREWAMGRDNVILLQESKKGACAARNAGLRVVKSEFVEFFDSDDIMLPHHIEEFETAIDLHPDVDIFGRDIYLQNVNGSRRRLYFSAKNPMFNHIFRSSLSTGRIVVRTELVRKVGGWNENLVGWDDYELGVRLLLERPTLLKLNGEPSVIALKHADSISGLLYSDFPHRWENAIDTIRQILQNSNETQTLTWLDARSMILAAQYQREADNEKDITKKRHRSLLALSLKNKVLGRGLHPTRMKLVYLHNRYFNRFTWVLVKLLFPC